MKLTCTLHDRYEMPGEQGRIKMFWTVIPHVDNVYSQVVYHLKN